MPTISPLMSGELVVMCNKSKIAFHLQISAYLKWQNVHLNLVYFPSWRSIFSIWDDLRSSLISSMDTHEKWELNCLKVSCGPFFQTHSTYSCSPALEVEKHAAARQSACICSVTIVFLLIFCVIIRYCTEQARNQNFVIMCTATRPVLWYQGFLKNTQCASENSPRSSGSRARWQRRRCRRQTAEWGTAPCLGRHRRLGPGTERLSHWLRDEGEEVSARKC